MTVERVDDQALREIPSLDAFLRRKGFDGLPRTVVARQARGFLDGLRRDVRDGRLAAGDVASWFAGERAETVVRERCLADMAPVHRPVVNATGIVLHTGIGRAPMADAAVAALTAAARYAVVEVDIASGKRNQREEGVASLLRQLLGVGGALVVNNNAAAVNLVLQALAKDREVVVSRGELVEIGGGFRMPDVMAHAGCRMVEVGATNRTHLNDFERALGPATGMLLKVHPSNYRMLGFAGTPSLSEIASLGRAFGVVVFEDLGSGFMLDEPLPGLEDEPMVRSSLAARPHLVCFSGDKLLGGPQCGILVGDADLVARVRAHPMYRAFRCDKLTLAALEATLRIYRDGDPLREIPTLRMLATPKPVLEERAQMLAKLLVGDGARVHPSESFAGSGANPAAPLPSFAVSLPGGERACTKLRVGAGTAIFARVVDDRVWLDARTLDGVDLPMLAQTIRAKLASDSNSR